MTGMQNLHTHTTYCDGALPPEEMIKAALEKGCGSIGFSEHSHVTFDHEFSMFPDLTVEYIREVNRLRDKYEGEIEVFLGLEQDYYTDFKPDGLDYTIGTLHYVKKGEQYIAVDAGTRHQKRMVEDFFGGDFYALAEDYYSVFAKIISKTNADIVGHFDLIAKYNIDRNMYDEMHPRHMNAALGAMDEILKSCKLFEVNTGAMYRNNKPEPYPSVILLKELYKRGGEVIMTSDSHDAGSLCYKFDEMRELLKSCGFKYSKRLTKTGFISERL